MQDTLANEVNTIHKAPRSRNSVRWHDRYSGSSRPGAGVQADVLCGALFDVEGLRMSAP